MVLSALLDRPTRFWELRDTNRMLSERLNELEADGIVEQVTIPETPVRIEYSPARCKEWLMRSVLEPTSGSPGQGISARRRWTRLLEIQTDFL